MAILFINSSIDQRHNADKIITPQPPKLVPNEISTQPQTNYQPYPK